jgi:hypothetical protein
MVLSIFLARVLWIEQFELLYAFGAEQCEVLAAGRNASPQSILPDGQIVWLRYIKPPTIR